MKLNVLFGLILSLVVCVVVATPYEVQSLKDGDILFQHSKGEFGQALELATGSQRTHVGIYFNVDGKPMVLEAVQPVRFISFDKWKQNGIDEKVEVCRLQNWATVLSEEVVRRMIAIGESWKGKNYDAEFHPNDRELYCSELVWKLYKRVCDIELGTMQPLSSFHLNSDLVQKRLKMHFGKEVPMDRLIISPQAIYDSELLTKVSL